MEKEPISKKEQSRDATLISLAGGVIGIIGAIAEINIFSASRLDINSAINMGGATLVGFSLTVSGLIKLIGLKRPPKEFKE